MTWGVGLKQIVRNQFTGGARAKCNSIKRQRKRGRSYEKIKTKLNKTWLHGFLFPFLQLGCCCCLRCTGQGQGEPIICS